MPRERGLDYEAGDLSFGGGNGPDMTLDWLTTSEASDTVGGSSHQLLTPPAAMSTTVGAAGGGLAGVSSAGRLSRSRRPTSGKGSGRPSQMATQRGASALSPLIPSPSPAALASAMASPAAGCGVRKWGENGTGMKQGKFSKAETNIIVDAVKVYAKNNDVSIERLCLEGGHKGDLKGAWLVIADCLPDRTVQSIYRHGIRQLHGMKRGPWSPLEVCTLQTLVSQHGNKWRTIEKSMGRSADTCRDKYREIIHLPGKGGGAAPKLRGDEKIDVQWADVSRMVGTRNRIACQKKWEYLQGQRLEQNRQSKERSTARINLTFVREIIKTKARDETEIIWNRLPYHRPQRRWRQLRGRTPAAENMGLQEALATVMERLKEEAVEEESLEANPLQDSDQDYLGGRGEKRKSKKKKNKKRGREQMEGGLSAAGSTRTDEVQQPPTSESPNATVADWDSLNLNCDQPISAEDDHLDLDNLSETLLPPPVGLAPIAARAVEPAGRSTERRNRKLMRAVALALDED
eukprot:jgi/Undpi1/8865/HiC_scaffold_25.g11327.m1